MKIAIPLFRERVSPRFDCAQKFHLLEVKNGHIFQSRDLPVKEKILIKRIKKLTDLGVDTVICGGIDTFSEGQLLSHGIKIFSWITGKAEDVFCCFLAGKLESGMMVDTGGRPCGLWQNRESAHSKLANP